MMATTFSVGIVGAKELQDVLAELVNDFGPKDSKNILVGAVRQSMRPALETAKANAPVDTGALRASLRIEARKPNRRDRASKYIDQGDVVIATVTTAPGKVLAKKSFKNVKTGKRQKGIPSDARAIAAEFGTANVAAQPFLRSSLESNSSMIVNDLSGQIRASIDKYKARQANKANKG
jgi:HK97 gp10 family phage protein